MSLSLTILQHYCLLEVTYILPSTSYLPSQRPTTNAFTNAYVSPNFNLSSEFNLQSCLSVGWFTNFNTGLTMKAKLNL